MSERERHLVHRCMRCEEEFACVHGGDPTKCRANYDVMPNIVQQRNGQPVVLEHCPVDPTWDYVRERVTREREAAARLAMSNGKRRSFADRIEHDKLASILRRYANELEGIDWPGGMVGVSVMDDIADLLEEIVSAGANSRYAETETAHERYDGA